MENRNLNDYSSKDMKAELEGEFESEVNGPFQFCRVLVARLDEIDLEDVEVSEGDEWALIRPMELTHDLDPVYTGKTIGEAFQKLITAHEGSMGFMDLTDKNRHFTFIFQSSQKYYGT